MANPGNALTDEEMERRLALGYIWRCGSCHNQITTTTPGPRGRFCHNCQDYGSLVNPNAH